MRTIKNKLSSQRGASLTFALLTFLVCAVVGSAVLTAGTAASGRISEVAERDQRYYSVNSAARLLIDLLEKDEIRYEETKSGNESGEDTSDENTDETSDETSDSAAKTYTFYINDIKVVDPRSLALDIARHALALKDSREQQEENPENAAGAGEDEEYTADLSLNVTENLGADLSVTIKETLSPNGDVQFEVKNTVTENQAKENQYTITLYFMNVGSGASFKWQLYDIESEMPPAPTPQTLNGGNGGN